MKYLGQKGAQVLVNKIKSKVLQYDTKESFEVDLQNKKINSDSLVLIKDTYQLWYENQYYQLIPDNGTQGQVLTKNSDGSIDWNTINFTGLQDILAYGVRIDESIKDSALTRIGNLALHKILPIQSQLRGCIAKGNKIQYWLNSKDWRFREIPKYITLTFTQSTTNAENVPLITDAHDEFSTLQYEGAYVKYVDTETFIGHITSIDTTAKKATIQFDQDFYNEVGGDKANEFELGSVRNGYDGNVMVYTPEFYIKGFTSEVDGDPYWEASTSTKEISVPKITHKVTDVYISTVKIDDTWEYQPEGLLGAYRGSILRTVPENMGYLSTLPQNAIVSIANTNTYCRTVDSAANDVYLSTDPFRTGLGKPYTVSYTQCNTLQQGCQKSGGNVLDYNTYKNVIYWLYVIEYANYNCQLAFNDQLTSEGYHQGGLGTGMVDWFYSILERYNGYLPIVPCGYLDEYGNSSNIGAINFEWSSEKETHYTCRYRGITNPFGDTRLYLGGLYLGDNGNIYFTKDTSKWFTDNNTVWDKKFQCQTSSDTTDIYSQSLGTSADIIPDNINTGSITYNTKVSDSALIPGDSMGWTGTVGSYAIAYFAALGGLGTFSFGKVYINYISCYLYYNTVSK